MSTTLVQSAIKITKAAAELTKRVERLAEADNFMGLLEQNKIVFGHRLHITAFDKEKERDADALVAIPWALEEKFRAVLSENFETMLTIAQMRLRNDKDEAEKAFSDEIASCNTVDIKV